MEFLTQTGPLNIQITQAIIAGWTGRNTDEVEHHIRELEAIGVPRPSQTPLHYRVSAGLLTQADSIQVVGTATSGEAEPLIVRDGDTYWIGLGSDHTDRALEAKSVALSKQVCPKPVARELWQYSHVQGHLDRLEITCWIRENGDWVDYQRGSLSKILPLDELIAGANLESGTAMLCGTFAAIGGVRSSEAIRMELTDPVLDRRIGLEYQTECLPEVS